MSFIFISYSRKDKAYVTRLTQALEKKQLPAWLDDHVDYGTKWPHAIQKHLEDCAIFLLVMSSRSYESDWVQNELLHAKEWKKPIFPLLLEGECWLAVASTQFIDVRGEKLPADDFFRVISQKLAVSPSPTTTSGTNPEKRSEERNKDWSDENNINYDLIKGLPLSNMVMRYGGAKNVEIENGKQITVNIPANVKEGQKLRIRGKGRLNPYTKDRGNLYLVIQNRNFPHKVSSNDESNGWIQESETELSSLNFGPNYYTKLRDLLAARDWKAANQETIERMCEIVGMREEKWMHGSAFNIFPCRDLYVIDKLWVKYSKGHFGFSVQKEVWEQHGNPSIYDSGKDWEKFGNVVGWRSKGRLGSEWIRYSYLTFDLTAPKGHLPVVGYWNGVWAGDRFRKGYMRILGHMSRSEHIGGVAILVNKLIDCGFK